MNQNTLQWKLFPFSLMGNAKIWYNRTTGRVGGDWIQLKDEFYLFFFPVLKVIPHRMHLLSFQQDDGESLGAVWARFMHLATSRPPHNIQEEMLMQHFIYDLNPKRTFHESRLRRICHVQDGGWSKDYPLSTRKSSTIHPSQKISPLRSNNSISY